MNDDTIDRLPVTDITKAWLRKDRVVHVTWHAIESEVTCIANRWREHVKDRRIENVYAIPRGGCVPGALVARDLGVPIIDRAPEGAARGSLAPRTLVIDDLVDSGKTAQRFNGCYLDAMFRKSHSPQCASNARTLDGWLVFPWEMNDDAAGPADAVVRLLEYIGEDPTRAGLVDTPDRVLRAFTEMTDGRSVDIDALLSRQFDGESYTGMVIVRDVDFVSLCEHHLLPFTGRATVAYIPGASYTDDEPRRVVGLSKLARLVDAFAHRLQIQERMTEQIADALVQHLRPEGVGVVLRATHSCMSCRGVRKADAEMVTSSLRGVLYDKASARAEFMRLAGC